MNYSKVGTIEGIFLICIGILNHSILYLPQSIFNICGTASILNIIYISYSKSSERTIEKFIFLLLITIYSRYCI